MRETRRKQLVLTYPIKQYAHYLPELRYIPFQYDDSQFHDILSRMRNPQVRERLSPLRNN